MPDNLAPEEIFRLVMADRIGRELLVNCYRHRQGLAGRPRNRVQASQLVRLGLAVEKGGSLYLTRAGASLAYNLVEVESQVERKSARSWLEKFAVNRDAAVLDAGCGGGQTLLAALDFNPRSVTGVDRDTFGIDFARFMFRRRGVPDPPFVFHVSKLEEMRFPPASFDRIICRGVLHKTRVGEVLALFASFLRPGGRTYLMAPGACYYFTRFRLAMRNPAWPLFFGFVFFNGSLFAATGRQVTLRVGRRRLSELFFTAGSLKRAARAAGLSVETLEKTGGNPGVYYQAYLGRGPDKS